MAGRTPVPYNDAFMSHSGAPGRTSARDRLATRARQTTSSGLCDCCAMVFLPWLFFGLIMLLTLSVQHYSTIWLKLGLALLFGMGALFLGAGAKERQGGLVVLGSLCLLCIAAGLMIGLNGWNSYMRPWYWLNTGRHYNVTGATPAAAVSDASTLRFWNSTLGRPSAVVDGYRSVGYISDDTYCVAPVLSPAQVKNDIPRVEYWAVGVNCCLRRGDFYCDAAGTLSASYALVAPPGAAPCPGGDRASFEVAIKQAESLYSVVSAPGALMVRWADDPNALRQELWVSCMVLLGSSLCYVLVMIVILTCFARLRGIDRLTTNPYNTKYTQGRAGFQTGP